MTKALAWLTAIVLVGSIPLGLLGTTVAPNRYRDWGLDAIDCDGPFKVFVVGVPAVAIYAAGALAFGWLLRGRLRLIAVSVCCLACLSLAVNLVRAAAENRRNADQAATCG